MDASRINDLLMLYSSKLPLIGMDILKSKLVEIEDESKVHVALSKLKSPTTAVILSVLCGAFGVDRFYIGDIGLGVGKLLTCGGFGMWTLIDIFLITDSTRKKNLEILLLQL